MGRKGSALIPFLQESLMKKKYINLQFEDPEKLIFSLILPRKNAQLSKEVQFILKDWYREKGRNYRFSKDYTEAKQGMEAALRRSVFLQHIESVKNKLIYEISSQQKVMEKKQILKDKKRKASIEINSDPPSVESGYYSGVDSPTRCQHVANEGRLLSVKHDHEYFIKTVAAETLPIYAEAVGTNTEDIKPISDSENTNHIDVCTKFNNFKINTSSEALRNSDDLFPYIEFDKDVDCVDLNSIPTSSLYPLLPDDEYNMLLSSLEDLPILNDHSEAKELPVADDTATASPNIKALKVYEFKGLVELPVGGIMLICEPKWTDFPITAGSDNDKGVSSEILYDVLTLQFISLYDIYKRVFLCDDTLLMFLKPKDMYNST